MFCPKCGNQLSDAAAFCNKCGAQVQAQQIQQAVENQAGNQNASEARPEAEISAVQNQAQVVSNAVSKPSIPKSRIAAFVVTTLTACTSFMTWYEPGYTLYSIVNNASSFLGLLSGGSVSIPTFEESYSIWMTPDLVNTVSTLLEYAGESSAGLLFLYIPFILFIFGIVLAVVGVVKTLNRSNSGKDMLVWANLVFLSACFTWLFIGASGDMDTVVYGSGYGVVPLPGFLCCFVISIVGIIVSAASKNPASAQA